MIEENAAVKSRNVLTLVLGFAMFGAYGMAAQTAKDAGTLRATLSNGMRVVIIHNSLAPVATVETNFMVGGHETPDGFPGMAHAGEHMAFRGGPGRPPATRAG